MRQYEFNFVFEACKNHTWETFSHDGGIFKECFSSWFNLLFQIFQYKEFKENKLKGNRGNENIFEKETMQCNEYQE